MDSLKISLSALPHGTPRYTKEAQLGRPKAIQNEYKKLLLKGKKKNAKSCKENLNEKKNLFENKFRGMLANFRQASPELNNAAIMPTFDRVHAISAQSYSTA